MLTRRRFGLSLPLVPASLALSSSAASTASLADALSRDFSGLDPRIVAAWLQELATTLSIPGDLPADCEIGVRHFFHESILDLSLAEPAFPADRGDERTAVLRRRRLREIPSSNQFLLTDFDDPLTVHIAHALDAMRPVVPISVPITPWQRVHAEQAVLSYCLLGDEEILPQACRLLQPETFAKGLRRTVFRALQQGHTSLEDVLAVVRTARSGERSATYVASLATKDYALVDAMVSFEVLLLDPWRGR